MENLSPVTSVVFLLTVMVSIWLFWKAAGYAKITVFILLIWAIIQSLLSLSGFYTHWEVIPPRFIFLVGPAFLLIAGLFFTKNGRAFIDSFDLQTLTILHTIRIPVEIVLFQLFTAKLIPQSMTFEGSNFDIVSGITAPIVYYLFFIVKKVNSRVLLIWNIVCLGLLINIVTIAILSAKTPLQQWAFDQPNIGVAYFPFSLLPGLVVPIVLCAHLIAIRRLVQGDKQP